MNVYQIKKCENKKIRSLYKVENEVTNRPTIIKIESEFMFFFVKENIKILEIKRTDIKFISQNPKI